MTHFRLAAVGTILMFALIAPAQQAVSAGTGNQEQTVPSAQDGMPSAEQHLKMLTEKLDLSVDQQAEIRPIIQQMLDARQKLMQNSSLSDDARTEKERALHEKAVKKARRFLNDEQKNKLDQLEQEWASPAR